MHPPPGHSPSTRTQFVGNLSIFRDEEETEVQISRVRKRLEVTDDAQIIAEEKELGGRNRYAADGLLNSIECNLLMQLTQVNEILILRFLMVFRCRELQLYRF